MGRSCDGIVEGETGEKEGLAELALDVGEAIRILLDRKYVSKGYKRAL